MCILAAFFDNLWRHLNGGISVWTIFGLTGNIMFTSRFVVQWYVSEKFKQSVIPKNFWHLSFLGGLINLIYALHVGAVPFILGSLLPPVRRRAQPDPHLASGSRVAADLRGNAAARDSTRAGRRRFGLHAGDARSDHAVNIREEANG